MNGAGYAYAAKELFVQFMTRAAKELPNAWLAMFSTLKYVNSDNLEPFRERWKATFKAGFITHSKAFDGLKGNFPIGFLIWNTGKKADVDDVPVRVLDKDGIEIGSKLFRNIPRERFLSKFIARKKDFTHEVVPLVNAITPTKR